MFFSIFLQLTSCFSFNYLKTQRISSKTQLVSIAATQKQLIVGVISDSLSGFRPNVSVYTVRIKGVSNPITHSVGNTGGFGRKIVPFSFGFLASSPQQAFYWGKPNPFIAKYVNGTQRMIDLNTSLVPYGETMGCSGDSNVICACSPLSADDCIILINDKYKYTMAKPDAVRYFALSVAVSPDGENIAILSTTKDNSLILSIHNVDENYKLKETHIIMENVDLSPKDNEPILFFRDNDNIVIALPQFGRVLSFKQVQEQWSLDKKYENSKFASFSKIANINMFMLLYNNGTIQIMDENFMILLSHLVPTVIGGNHFTSIVSGDNWFAALEESDDKRYIHIISTADRHYGNAISFVLVLSILAIILVIFRKKLPRRLTMRRTMSKSSSKLLLD